jgi:hypothetical protein
VEEEEEKEDGVNTDRSALCLRMDDNDSVGVEK